MNKLASLTLLGASALALAACGEAEDASTEAMPDTVEMPAEEALVPIEAEPVEDDAAVGPPVEDVDPAQNAPDVQTTSEAANAAEQVAQDAVAAAEAAEAAATDTE